MNFLKIVFIIFNILIINNSLTAQFGLSMGTEYGFGVVTRIGPEAVKVEGGGGVSPLVVFWSISQTGFGSNFNETSIKFYLPATFGGKINFKLSGEKNDNRFGIKFGISHNTILKTGYGGGLYYESIGKSSSFVISGGLMYYKNAEKELLVRLIKDEGVFFRPEDVSAPLLNYQPFFSVHLLW